MSSSRNTQEFEELAQRAAQFIKSADIVLIAAGAGMSFESGLDDITEEGFKRKFPSLHKLGFKTMLEAISIDFEEEPEFAWGYYATRMKWYREAPVHEGYKLLLDICEKKGDNNYYVFTSNVDGLFEKAGFPDDKIYTKQGSYKYLQCINGPDCSQHTWIAEEALQETEKYIDPTHLMITDAKVIPRCPKCGSVAYHNANAGKNWVHDHYDEQRKKFFSWLRDMRDQNRSLVIIELGCGERLPFIRHPVENIVDHFAPYAKLVRVNPIEPEVPEEWLDDNTAVGLPLGAVDGMKLISNYL